MDNIKLTEDEQRLLDDLYGLPKRISFRKPTHIWIIEWLSSNDPRKDPHTGRELHEWMQEYLNYSFRSVYWKCSSKDKVLAAIERAATHAEHHGTIPLIHLEAHGSEEGLSDRGEGANGLIWDELTKPLQRLNIATQCNLFVLFAACKGYSGFKSILNYFKERDLKIKRAPAFVIAGPSDDLQPDKLFKSMKELYKCLSEQSAVLSDAIFWASNESGCKIVTTISSSFIYSGLLYYLISCMRNDQREAKVHSAGEKLLSIIKKERLSLEEKRLLKELNQPNSYAEILQQEWDACFMIDIFPENKERFGVDLLNVTEKILGIQQK